MKKRESGMAIKLDLANTFDRLRHDFIFMVLEKFGFPPIFVKQIQACISPPWISPLINGRPSDFFKAKRGIKQGCPLSPFLYILVANSLSRRLNKLLEERAIPGISFKPGIRPINHTLFVDESILLGVHPHKSPRALLILWNSSFFHREVR